MSTESDEARAREFIERGAGCDDVKLVVDHLRRRAATIQRHDFLAGDERVESDDGLWVRWEDVQAMFLPRPVVFDEALSGRARELIESLRLKSGQAPTHSEAEHTAGCRFEQVYPALDPEDCPHCALRRRNEGEKRLEECRTALRDLNPRVCTDHERALLKAMRDAPQADIEFLAKPAWGHPPSSWMGNAAAAELARREAHALLARRKHCPEHAGWRSDCEQCHIANGELARREEA